MTEVRSVMTKKVITVQATFPIEQAHKLMENHGIRHLPVIDQAGHLVGMISDRDIQRAISVSLVNEIDKEFIFNPHHIVEDFMNWPVQTIDEKMEISDCAKMMIDEKVSALIVTAPNIYMRGIITTENILQYLIELIGSSETVKQYPLRDVFWRNPE